MRFRGFFLLVHSVVAAAASIQNPPIEQQDVTRKPLKGTNYEIAETSSSPPTYKLYGKEYEDGKLEMAKISYRKTTLTRQPVLDIRADSNIGAQGRGQKMALSTLIKGVTAAETNIKLNSVPYVIFSNYQLWQLIYYYGTEKQRGRPKSHKITPKDKEFWAIYENTFAFRTIKELAMPRKIKRIEVDIKGKGHETRFILG